MKKDNLFITEGSTNTYHNWILNEQLSLYENISDEYKQENIKSGGNKTLNNTSLSTSRKIENIIPM